MADRTKEVSLANFTRPIKGLRFHSQLDADFNIRVDYNRDDGYLQIELVPLAVDSIVHRAQLSLREGRPAYLVG